MSRLINLLNKRFGRLLVIARVPGGNVCRFAYWKCLCDCGGSAEISSANLLHGGTQSCGCIQREITIARSRTHRHAARKARTRTYITWANMVQRCTDPNWVGYGARGIKVCDRWRTFENFLADMGERPAGRSIDRIDGTGNYELSNCRWSTPKEQAGNRRKRMK